MPEPFASVLIPTRAPGPSIEQVLDAVFHQRPGFDFEVLVVDSGSAESDLDRIRRFPVSLRCIKPAAFDHGGTRNLLARNARGSVLLYLSQDARPASNGWMESLVGALDSNRIAGAYARQIACPGSSPLTEFFLLETYGEREQKRILQSASWGSIRDIFFSNVSSAIRRDVWERIPFRYGTIMSEDQYWAYDALRAGFDLAYEPRALVYHSHDYNLLTLFRRNWASGSSLCGLIGDSPIAMAQGWTGYFRREIAFLVRNGHTPLLPYALVYELDRALAFALGIWTTRARVGSPRAGIRAGLADG